MASSKDDNVEILYILVLAIFILMVWGIIQTGNIKFVMSYTLVLLAVIYGLNYYYVAGSCPDTDHSDTEDVKEEAFSLEPDNLNKVDILKDNPRYPSQRPGLVLHDKKLLNGLEHRGYGGVKDFDVQIFNHEPIENWYKFSGAPGDTRLANRMKWMSLKNKQSKINRAKMDRDTFKKYYEEELETHANRRWWDNDDLEYLM